MSDSKHITKKIRSGIPMSEKSLQEWEQAFIDIEESIKNIYKNDKKVLTNKK